MAVPYSGKVRVLVPFTPWRLLINMDAVEISERHVACRMTDTPQRLQVYSELLVGGTACNLQLDHEFEFIPAPITTGLSVASEIRGAQLSVRFSWDQPCPEVLALIAECGARH